jgi:hypothetical protein
MTNEQSAALDKIANAMMNSRPDLEPMSLDEWLLEHNDKLSDREKQAAFAILRLFD